MKSMRTEGEVLAQLRGWAEGNSLVRAVVLTSSRAVPGRETDFLSDYDVELYVKDLEPFARDDRWLDAFGSILVRWPYRPRATCGEGGITRLVLFGDGVRIDFQISDKTSIPHDAYDDGYEVLVGKDDLTAGLDPPTYSEHLVRKPSAEEYEALVHEFWWDATYVPKYLWRDELPFAASMLGQAVRDEFLRKVVEWYIGLKRGWSVNTGVRGRRFKRYLDAETWSEYASTFAGAGIEENWKAFFNAVALFRRLAREAGEGLGYEYPEELDREMTAYYLRIRNTKRECGRHLGGGP